MDVHHHHQRLVWGFEMNAWGPRLLHETLQRSCHAAPERPALREGDRFLDYGELWRDVRRLASWLQEQGVRRGDRVVLFLENSLEVPLALYAVSLAGGTFTVVHPRTPAPKLRYLIADCSPRLIITEPGLAATVREARGDAAVDLVEIAVGATPHGFHHLTDGEAELDRSPAISLDLASLIYTSGSTGEPKGVMLTHQNMVFAAGSLVQYLRLGPEHRILCALPLSFDYGLYQILMGILMGGTVVIQPDIRFPAHLIAALAQSQATVFPAVPTIFSTLLQLHERQAQCFPGVQRVTNTAAALSPAYIPRLREIFPSALIFSMYGLTECKRVSYLEPELLDQHPESVGRAIPGTEVMILDDAGQQVGPHQLGILHVRGPHVMAGYWRKPEATAEMLRPGPIAGERMLRTGDWFTQDEDGLLYFHGRSDDIIKCRGQKVSPREIENVLHGLSGVAEAAVVGVPDATLGEAIRAYVVPQDGHSLAPSHVVRWCRQHLEDHAAPQDVVITETLPHTDNGKLDRKALAAMARG